MSQSRVVGAVEIGTSKVAVLLGEILEDGGLNIIGHTACSSRGVKKGTINDLSAASDCVHAAIHAVEKAAQTRVDEVYLAQTGAHVRGMFNLGATNVSASDGVIRSVDINSAKEDAKRKKLPASRTYIHHIQNPFVVDGRQVEQPLSQQGNRLEVGYWSVHGDSQTVSDSLRVIQGIDLDVSDMIISSIASGAVLLEESEKENGALVIDIGGGTTDYAVDIFHKAKQNMEFECFLNEDTRLPMMFMEDAIRGTIDLMEAPLESINIRSSYNISGIDFTPKELYDEIAKHIPDFKISYKPDFKQEIADSWPNSIDDSEAQKDWGWKVKFDLESMVKIMLDNIN